MRCLSYCTASEYKIVDLVEYLNNKGLEPKYFDDAVYVQLRDRKDTNSDVFFFPFPCIPARSNGYVDEVCGFFKLLSGTLNPPSALPRLETSPLL